MPKYKKIKIAQNRAAANIDSQEFTNFNILSSTTAVFTQELLHIIYDLQTRLSNYENHTHSYTDNTINDTSDGSGTTITTSKVTGIVTP